MDRSVASYNFDLKCHLDKEESSEILVTWGSQRPGHELVSNTSDKIRQTEDEFHLFECNKVIGKTLWDNSTQSGKFHSSYVKN